MNLTKRYGDALLFENASFVINAGERVGLVGPNGSGKTTLLRILVGEERADSGTVRHDLPPERIGYLPQGLIYPVGTTVGDVLRRSETLDPTYWEGVVARLGQEMAAASGHERPALEREYASALDRLQYASTFAPAYQLERVLAGLGLAGVPPATEVAVLSGGQRTRVSLARLLLQHPALLLLDEPTNHLDIDALEWLERYLASYDGAILLVSHDRAFLDSTVTAILELDPRTHRITTYAGRYTDYIQAKERAHQRLLQAYDEQQERIARLEAAVRDLKGQASRVERETINFYYRKRAKKVARQAVVQHKRVQRMLDAEEHLEKPVVGWQMKLSFGQAPASGQDVLTIQGISKSFGARRLLADVNLTLRQGERIALIGPNGSGKTTLLRIIIGELAADDGTVRLGSNVRPGYVSQGQDQLDGERTPLEIARQSAPLSETDARTFLHLFLFEGDDVFTPIGRLSYGERARLTLATLVLQGCNLLLLDEPINHLDIPSRERFERALAAYDGTIIAAVHDRYFVQRLATAIWAIHGGTARQYADLADVRRAQQALAGSMPR